MGKRRIIAFIGDQLGDMELYPPDISPADYLAHYSKTGKWGSEYFMLPNPQYGYWVNDYQR
jgi:predicted secreted acid phosphatase